MPLENKAIYEGIKAGDSKSFESIFFKLYAPLCAFARQYVSPSDAENIVQDVMLWLWENRKEIDIQTSLQSYLFTATKNRCYTLITRGAIKSKVINSVHLMMQDRFDNPDFYEINELTQKLNEALAELPEEHRKAFELNRFHNKSYKEIADETGVSVKTVDYRIQQTLKILRVKLKDYLPIIIYILYK